MSHAFAPKLEQASDLLHADHLTNAQPARAALAASEEPPRRILLAGIETASGAPLQALATGSRHRPVVRAFASLATLAAQHREGGAA